MSIEFNCTNCSKRLRVDDNKAGKRCKCPSCGASLSIPSPRSAETSSPEPEDNFDIKVEIECPKCRSVLFYGPELEGTRGLCKACGHIFTLSQEVAEPVEQANFPFQCPNCAFMFEGKPGMEGRKGKCTECGLIFEIKPMPLQPTDSLKPTTKSRDHSSSLPMAKPVPSKPAYAPPLAKPIPAQTEPADAMPNTPTLSTTIQSNSWQTLNLPSQAWPPTKSNSGGFNPYAAAPSNSVSRSSHRASHSKEFDYLRYQFLMLGIMMIIIGVVGSIFGGYMVVSTLLGLFKSDISLVDFPDDTRSTIKFTLLLYLVACGLATLAQLFIILGGVYMLRRRGRRLITCATVMTLIPGISPCCILGIPFGIWGLVLLMLRDSRHVIP